MSSLPDREDVEEKIERIEEQLEIDRIKKKEQWMADCVSRTMMEAG